MKIYIYRSTTFRGYIVLRGSPWPYGYIECWCATLWGARRRAKRLAKRNSGLSPVTPTFIERLTVEEDGR